MAELILMVRGVESMFISTSKLADYLADGWLEVSRSAVTPAEPDAPDEKPKPSKRSKLSHTAESEED